MRFIFRSLKFTICHHLGLATFFSGTYKKNSCAQNDRRFTKAESSSLTTGHTHKF